MKVTLKKTSASRFRLSYYIITLLPYPCIVRLHATVGQPSGMETESRISVWEKALCKLSERLRGNVNLTTRKRLLSCYVFFCTEVWM